VSRAVDLIIAASPQRLILDNSRRQVQLYPEEVRQMVTVIGKRATSSPPLIMLGIEWCDDEETIAEVEQELRNLSSTWSGHRVLLIFREHGVDFSAAATAPLVLSMRALLEPEAAATLLFRDEPQRHFLVVHSTLDGLSVGAKVRDPRPAP
jgi:hypothetical protein